MFLGDGEKKSKEKILSELLSNLEEMDGSKLGKKPIVAEMSVTEVKPDKMGMMEDREMEEGETEDDSESSEMTPEDKALLMQLVSKYLK